MFNIANCCFSQDLYSATEVVPFGNFAFILRCIGLGCAGLSSGVGVSGNLGISVFLGAESWVTISVSSASQAGIGEHVVRQSGELLRGFVPRKNGYGLAAAALDFHQPLVFREKQVAICATVQVQVPVSPC